MDKHRKHGRLQSQKAGVASFKRVDRVARFQRVDKVASIFKGLIGCYCSKV